MTCLLCNEPITEDQDAREDIRPIRDQFGTGRQAHRECLLRSVMGGIGHHENHGYWCNEMHDPDGGRSYRQSALEVDEWVHKHGLP